MKHMPLIFVSSLSFLLTGCFESTKTKTVNNSSSNSYCTQYPTAWGCPGYNGGTTTGGTSGVSTSCSNPTIYDKTCATYCTIYPYPQGTGCLSNGTNCNINPTATGCNTTTTPPGINPFPRYYSGYVDKNWSILYPYSPSISCTDATTPSGISYTPYETRKGTITLKGQEHYDLYSGQLFFDTTSELLRTKTGAKNFFWGDSILKIRFKSNLQPESANSTAICPNRKMGYSSIKGYGKIKFDLYIVGVNGSNETTIYHSSPVVSVNSCTTAINLSSYLASYPDGIYLKIRNVKGNQNWLPGTNTEAYYYDMFGYISPNNPYVSATWKDIRNMECWSLDIEVASDGTKTFN